MYLWIFNNNKYSLLYSRHLLIHSQTTQPQLEIDFFLNKYNVILFS